MRLVGRGTPTEIPILEGVGVSEIFINGTVTEVGQEIVVIILYRERDICDCIERYEVARAIMSRADYDANLRRAYKRWCCVNH